MSPWGCRGPSCSLTSGQSLTGQGCQGLRIHGTCQGSCGVSGASPWQRGRHPGIRCSPSWEEDAHPVSQALLGSNRLGVLPGKMDLHAAGLSLPLDSRGTSLGGLCLENDSEGPRCAPLAKPTPSVSHRAGMTQREPQAPGRGSTVCPPCLGKPRVPGMLLHRVSFGDKGVHRGLLAVPHECCGAFQLLCPSGWTSSIVMTRGYFQETQSLSAWACGGLARGLRRSGARCVTVGLLWGVTCPLNSVGQTLGHSWAGPCLVPIS